ncbi:hypothetical protein [Ekhidna sp.]
MSTRKLSDNEFDKYAKNILKRPDVVPFDQSAWAAMESKLASQPIPGWKGTISQWTSYVINSVILFSLMFIISHNGETSASKVSLIQSETLTPLNIRSEDSVIDTALVGLEKPIQEHTSNTTQADTNIDKELISNSSQDSGFEIVTNTKKNNVTEEASTVELYSQSTTTTEKSQLPKADPIILIRNSNAALNNEHSFIMRRGVDIKTAELSIPKFLLFQTDSVSTEEQVTKSIRKKGINLGIVLSPDFTTVGGFNEFDSPGLDYGITFEYYVLDRFSVSSGAVVTSKLYRTTDLNEYQLPQGFWSGAIPEQINADCRVIDIPLNLRYYAIEGKRNTLFLSAGMSSYIMLNEVYSYDYPQQYANDPNRRDAVTVTNENNHFFGVYNLSAGIQRQVSEKFFIEFEPYLKQSLDGVGWGQVQLNSTGVLFNIKYHFNTN